MSPTIITPEQRSRALRIYAAALPLIAEAVGIDPAVLHTRVIRITLAADLFPKPAAPTPLTNAAEVDDLPKVIDHPPSPAETSSVGEGNLHKSDHPEGAENEVEPTPVLMMKPATQATWDEKNSTGLVTLRNRDSGEYLNMDGSGTTINRSHAYRGTITQAKAMRAKSPAAAGMSISHLTQK